MDYAGRTSAAEDLVFDAVRIRLVEIGEAVKGLSDGIRAREPEEPWTDIARMRDSLAHHYFDTSHAIVTGTARSDVPALHAAVLRLLGHA
ncbi:HepT-like ribonuclease domain-containing protein [Herbiconiux sp. P18]|uniref:HepT-like ribonuclease domain-containing protein n=1 Tax=Herbiconiux liangxiaofengii TaxID=3342795 RepID=UPI0035BA6E4A